MGMRRWYDSRDFMCQQLAPSARFERARYGLEGRCSIQLSYEGNPMGRLLPGKSSSQ